MKKASLVVNIVLAVAVVILYVLHFMGKPNHIANEVFSNEKTDGATALSDEYLVAWVNIDTLLNSYDMYFDYQKELETKGRKMESEMNTRTRAFEKSMMDFQDKVQKGLITRSQAQTMQEDLAAKEQELYRFRDELRMQFAEEEQVKLRQIQQNINDFLVEYNKDKGFHVILSSSFGGPVLYGHPSVEITKDVLKGLNDKYIQGRPEKK
jgi:outer membrane protein